MHCILTGRACERSGKISRSSLSSIHGTPAHRSAPLRSFDFLSFDPLRSAARPDLRGEVRAPDLPTNRGPTTPVIFSFFFAADYISYMLTFNKAFSYK